MFKGKSLLITGGTGSFGKAFVTKILNNFDIKRLVILVEMNLNSLKCLIPNLLKDIQISYDFFRRCKRF